MTIPTSYTIRALNRWLAALKLETDSPIIRALHAAVDELDDDPNDLVADAEALLLAAASMSVLSFDALEHAAGEIGLEVDEEERAEVRESATLMQGLADLLGEIRTRTAEDREGEGEPFDDLSIGPDGPRDASGSAPVWRRRRKTCRTCSTARSRSLSTTPTTQPPSLSLSPPPPPRSDHAHLPHRHRRASSTEESEEEDRRVLYVGATRARDVLVLSRPSMTPFYNGQMFDTIPSPFLGFLEAA